MATPNWFDRKVDPGKVRLNREVVSARINERGIKQSEIAEKLGISESTLSSMIHGNQYVSITQYLKPLSEMLELPLDGAGPEQADTFQAAVQNLVRHMVAQGFKRVEVFDDGTVMMKGKG